ncbi:MAG: NAD(P)-dependent alcohol dehydrogenase [Planctomycetota bacterium]
MQAAIIERYGLPGVLQFRDVEKPTPGDRDILIRNNAVTVTSGDCRIRAMNMPPGFKLIARLMFGWSKPRQSILGTELAGVVEATGKDVTNFSVGDEVFASCDPDFGAYAEYKCLPAERAAIKPANLSFGEAAALTFGGVTALHFFRLGNLQPGERLLINGASGGVGTAAIQVAKHMGAEVTAVCSTSNLELVRSLGADETIDYTQTDFTESDQTYDLILDAAGAAPFSRCRRCLNPGGRFLMILGSFPQLLRAPWDTLTTDKKVIGGGAKPAPGDLQRLADMAAAGQLSPHIDRTYPWAQLVEAHRYVDQGRKRGNVVVQFDCSPAAG